jgi:hypothetical protein
MKWVKKIFKKEALEQPDLHGAAELNAAIWMAGKLSEVYGYKLVITFEKLPQNKQLCYTKKAKYNRHV